MNIDQWNQLPDLLRRRDVLALGISKELLAAATAIVQSGDQVPALPARTIAAIRPERKDGKRARLLYFKRTVGVFTTFGK